MKAYWLLLPAMLLIAVPARALETYCQSSGTRVHDGGHYEARWLVVHPKARRVQSKTTPSCSIAYSSVGAMYRPIEIITAPKNGRARVTTTYRITYEPSKMGPDALTIRIYWIGQRGDYRTATVRYNIEVIDRPL